MGEIESECSAKNFTKKQFEEIIIKFIKIIYEKFGYNDIYYSSTIKLDKNNSIPNKKKKSCAKC